MTRVPLRAALVVAAALASGCERPPPAPAPVAPVASSAPAPVASSAPSAPASAASPPAASAADASAPPPGSLAADYTFRVLAPTDAVHEPEPTQGEDQAGVADLGDKLLAYRGQQLWEVVGGALAPRKELLAGLPVRPEGREEMNIVGLYGTWPSRAFLVANVHGGDCATHAVYRWERARWQRVTGPGTAAGLGDHPGLCATYTDVGPWKDGALLASNNGAGKPEVFPRGGAPFDLAGLRKTPHLATRRCDTLFALTSTASGHAFAAGLRCAKDGALQAIAARWAPGAAGARRPTDEQPLPVPPGTKELTILSMYAASEREVYAAGTADEHGYLAVFDGAAWRTIDVPGAREITKVRGRPVWLVADGRVYVSRLRRDAAGAWSDQGFAAVALPAGVGPAGFFDVVARASGEVLLVGGPGIVVGRGR